jgi:hypothetical protein
METKIHHRFRLLGLAVLGLLTATACSNDDNTSGDSSIDEPVLSSGIPFSATISAAGAGSQTRALSGPDASDVITATWAVNEQVAMVYKVGSETKVTPATVSAVSDGTGGKVPGTATITAMLDENVTTDTPVTLVYPYSAVDQTAGDNFGQVKSDVFAHQDGTIAGISANCDLRQATGTITLATSPASLSSNVSMDSQIAIWKLSLKKDASTALNATKLDIYFGGKTASATPASTPTSTLFMAVPAGATGLTIIASDGTDSYIYNKASVTLAASTYYQSTVTLAKQTTRSITTSDGEVTLNDGDVVTGTGGTSTQLKIAAGATVTLAGVTNANFTTGYKTGIECAGNATIILADGTINTFKGNWERAAVYIPSGSTLTIRGGGTLIADNSGAYGAGIGGSYQNDCGNIVIEGGNITAIGTSGAGIGGGNNHSCGTITITGGTITATGGDYAAGIGSGHADQAANTCGDISISGSTQVTATGGDQAASIGSGWAYQAANTCGDISISGSAQVTATGGANAAGIGSGNGYSDELGNIYVSSCGAISIAGGTIEARGGNYAAGIGSGSFGKFTSISITKDITSVTATRSNYSSNAPIGKGNEDQGIGAVTFDGVVMHNGTGDAKQENWAKWPEDGGPFGGIQVRASDYGSNKGKTWTLTPSN